MHGAMRLAAFVVLAVLAAAPLMARSSDPWAGRRRHAGRPVPAQAPADPAYALDRPLPGPGWDEAALAGVWTRLAEPRLGPRGLTFSAPADGPGIRTGARLAVYCRGEGRQGLVGRAEVLGIKKRVATLRVWTLGAAEPWLHDPWKGWQRRLEWQPGFEPGRVEWYASAMNLTALEPARFEAVLSGLPPRGTPGLDVQRMLGAPVSLGRTASPRGPQEQWGYDLGPGERTYVYVETAGGTMTGGHRGHLDP